jgi:glycoprotein-N-acetylgalactosamine 3-beta-galactosyltransferase
MRNKLKALIYLILFLFLTLLISYGFIRTNYNNDIFYIHKHLFEIENDLNRTGSVLAKVDEQTTKFQSLPTIFCIILTNKNNFNTKTKLIHDTWAQLCDNQKFVSNFPDELYINVTSNDNAELVYKNMSILQPPGMKEDVYGKLTDKVYMTLKYVNNRYGNYDWYLKADDDTFIFINNLRKFLSSKNSSKPVTYGYDFKVIVENGYHSGGGGYVLSKGALNKLGSKLNEDYRFCPNTGTEDVDIAKCLRKLNILPEKSIDNLGRERFHPLSLMAHYNGDYPDWLRQYASNPLNNVIKISFNIPFLCILFNKIIKIGY